MASKQNISVSTSPKGEATAAPLSSPRGQCLCSPTTHEGSFRCRFHRARSSAFMKRSNSMPTSKNGTSSSVSSLSPKSVDSA
ncbi:hypothetical protein ACJRO7_016316 [Eucalyptus globulus]|uniref:Serine-rich protein-like protein n=1 Tax=Eucalyptus globulus TaxID=34317 RepID=A0ABD3L6M6_EUCGL